MLNGVTETKDFLNDMRKKSKKMNLSYVLSNLRMSICELG
jgi:hypothetical protein